MFFILLNFSFELEHLKKQIFTYNEMGQNFVISISTKGKTLIQVITLNQNGIYNYDEAIISSDTTIYLKPQKPIYSDNFPYVYTNGIKFPSIIIIQNLENKKLNIDIKGVEIR
ncbi:MAG: hypothetical protein ABIL76_02050 [candidate division WOR-3 bacterium]